MATRRPRASLMPLLRRCIPTAVVAAAGVALATAPAAMAGEYRSHTFCDNYLAPGGTCPPEGSIKYGHLYEVQGTAAGESHETCVDAWTEEFGYINPPSCMYYSGETAVIYPEGLYGYPRAWNGGSVNHTVWGWEYYYVTE